MKEENAGVKLENNTEETVSVKDTDGKTQKVETGEEITSDNYSGKTDEISEEEKKAAEEAKKAEEEKKAAEEAKKEEEKKNETTPSGSTGGTSTGGTSTDGTSTGGGSTGGSSTDGSGSGGSTGGTTADPVVVITPEEQLRKDLEALVSSGEDKITIEKDVILTSDLTIPARKTITVADGVTLDAKDHTITFAPDTQIELLVGSKLIVGKNCLAFLPDDNGFTAADMMLKYDAELTVDGYVLTGTGNDYDPVPTRVHFENCIINRNNDFEPESAICYTERRVRFDFLGQKLLIKKENGSKEGFAKAFGAETSRWQGDKVDFGEPADGGLYTEIGISYLSNVLYDKRTVTFNEETVMEFTTGPEDWISCLLDPGIYWFTCAARNIVEPYKTAPNGVTRTPDGWDEFGPAEGEIFVTVGNDADFVMTKDADARVGTIKITPEVCRRVLGSYMIHTDCGGKVAIDGYLFETKDHGTNPDRGEFGLMISLGTNQDGSKHVRLQLPEDVAVYKFDTNNNERSAFTANDIDGFNAWAAEKGIKVEIINKNRMTYTGQEPWDPDYFPSVKIEGYDCFVLDGTLVKGEYTGGNKIGDNYEYSTGSLAGLMGIWRDVEPPVGGENGGPKWSTINMTEDLELEHMTMGLPATLVFGESKNLTLLNNAHFTASVIAASGSAVKVTGGCSLGTTQGSNSIISGELYVDEGASFAAQMGSTLIIKKGGEFNLYGTLKCGAVKSKGESENVQFEIWFMNDGGKVNGSGTVLIEFHNLGVEPFTDDEKEDIIRRVNADINNHSITVKEYDPTE